MPAPQTRITFVAPRATVYFSEEPVGTPGGAERQMYYLGMELSKRDNFKISYLIQGPQPQCVNIAPNVLLHEAYSASDGPLRTAAKLLFVMRNLDAHVLVFRAASSRSALAMLYSRLILARRVVYMVANEDECNPSAQARLIGYIPARLMALAYRVVNAVVVQNESQRIAFEKNRRRRTSGLVRSVCPLPTGPVVERAERHEILWVGRSHPCKRGELFVRLAESFPDQPFRMVCPPADGHEAEWERVKSMAERTSNLQFEQFVAPSEMQTRYSNAKVYVITSSTEGMPNTALEAMAAGCPVLSIGTDPDGIIVRNQLGVYVNDGDLLQGIAALDGLLKSEETRDCMGRNGQRYIRDTHAPDIAAEQLTSVLDQVCHALERH